MKYEVQGLDEVMERLNQAIGRIKGRTLEGFIKGAVLIRRQSEDVPPLTPVDTGNLRASWFTVYTGPRSGETSDGNFKGDNASRMASEHSAAVSQARSAIEGSKEPVIVFGYTANYAGWVHENMEARFQRPGAGPKFLQEAAIGARSKVLKVIAEAAR